MMAQCIALPLSSRFGPEPVAPRMEHRAATIPHMSGGRLAKPPLIRMATGAWRQPAAQHSHSMEGWYANAPKLRILARATPAGAGFMLASALAGPNPILIFESAMLYGAEGGIPAGITAVDIARAAGQQGQDVTTVTHGGSLPKPLEAADRLAAHRLGLGELVAALRDIMSRARGGGLRGDGVAHHHAATGADHRLRSHPGAPRGGGPRNAVAARHAGGADPRPLRGGSPSRRPAARARRKCLRPWRPRDAGRDDGDPGRGAATHRR
jgi:hypothetical protein